MSSGSPLSVKIAVTLAFVLSLLAILVGTALYQWHFRQERQEVANTLAAIADVKTRQLSGWLGERVGDANAFAINPSHVRDLDDCKRSDLHCEGLFGALNAVVSAYRYRSAAVVDLDGRVLTSAGEEYALHRADRDTLGRIAAGGGTRVCDLHYNNHGQVELEVAAPMIRDGRIVAVVFLVIDTSRTFFPLVSSWPLPGSGGEVMLLRIDDTDALVLSPLRQHPDAALSLRVPLLGEQIAARAVVEPGSLVAGPDYRGRESIGVSRGIPDMPWVLLVQQDASEVKTSVGWSAAATATITAMFVVMTGAVALIWVIGRLDRFRLKEQNQRRLLEAQTEWLRRFGNDIVLLVDEQGRVVDANDRAELAFGYSRDELLQMSIHDLRSQSTDMRQSPLDLDAVKGEGQLFRTWHRRKDGSEFPVEVSLRALVIDGQRMYQDIVRDITERVAAEAVISRQARMYSALSQTNKVVLRAHDRQILLDELCDCAVRLGGFRGAWVAMRTESETGELDIASLRGELGAWPGVFRLTLDPDDPYGQTATAAAIREEQPQCRRDVQTDPALGAWHDVIETMGLQAVAAFPIRECGEVCGAFTVFSQDNETFTPETLALLAEMADDLSFGLDYLLRENWRRIAEESLRQSEIRYRALVEDHPGMLCRFLADGTLTFVNDAYCRVFGKPAHQLLGSSFYELIPDEDVEFARSQVAKLGPDNPTLTYVHRAIGDGGMIRWQEWTDRALLDSGGRVVEYQSAGKDITDRIEMEQALRDSQEFLTAMAAATRDAIIVMDDRGRVTYWNNSAEVILGYTRDEAMGQAVHSLIGNGEGEHSFLSNMVRFRETGGGAVIGRTLELQARNKAGETFPVELSVNAFRLKGDWHAVGVLRDIRDRKEMELTLWQSQKMESLGNLAGGIAHDINNMLQPILGFAIMLEDDVPEQARPSVRIILDAANRIKALVEQILMFSRKEEIVREPLDISRIVQQAVNFLRSTIPASIQVVENIGSVEGTVVADRTQIHAVLLNLVSNAVDAMDGGVGTLRISLSVKTPSSGGGQGAVVEDAPYAVIEVSDTGGGMDERTISRMFDPFFTTKPAGKGTGLGLSIVHGIVTQHGGFVQVHSTPGQGTSIRIWLPLTKGENEGDGE